jgi:hypothetical protein
MKVKLNFLERVVIQNILPKQGDIAGARAANNTRKILKFSHEEQEQIKEHTNPQGMLQNNIGDAEKEYDNFPPSSVKLIRETLKELDAKKQISVDAVSVYDKFFPDETEKSA